VNKLLYGILAIILLPTLWYHGFQSYNHLENGNLYEAFLNGAAAIAIFALAVMQGNGEQKVEEQEQTIKQLRAYIKHNIPQK
jgi:hypothetical protein